MDVLMKYDTINSETSKKGPTKINRSSYTTIKEIRQFTDSPTSFMNSKKQLENPFS